MTVRELIAELQLLPQGLLILVPGYKSGAEAATNIQVVTVRDDNHPRRRDYDGRYRLAWDPLEGFVALYISGAHDPL